MHNVGSLELIFFETRVSILFLRTILRSKKYPLPISSVHTQARINYFFLGGGGWMSCSPGCLLSHSIKISRPMLYLCTSKMLLLTFILKFKCYFTFEF